MNRDTIIVISYGAYDPDDLEHYEPRVVHVGRDNEIRTIDSEVAALLGAGTEAGRPAAIA
jgi:aspartate 1-decarboxylase